MPVAAMLNGPAADRFAAATDPAALGRQGILILASRSGGENWPMAAATSTTVDCAGLQEWPDTAAPRRWQDNRRPGRRSGRRFNRLWHGPVAVTPVRRDELYVPPTSCCQHGHQAAPRRRPSVVESPA
jgi:hypothetical protein